MINIHPLDLKNPGILFCLGWAAVMLCLLVSVHPVWDTFMHMWRVEFTASIFLFAALAYTIYNNRGRLLRPNISRGELKWIVIPISAFICWSSLSMLWANSLMSAFHHTLVWAEYLIFYLIVRQVIDSGRNYSVIARMLTGTLCFFAILAVFSYIGFLLFGGGTSVGIIYSKYCEQIVTLLPLLIVGVLRLKDRKFAVGAAALALLWLLVYCSQSRTGLILFVAVVVTMSALVFLLKRFRPHRLRMAILLVAFVVAPIPLHLVSLFANGQATVLGRIRDDKGNSGSNDFRKLMIHISVGMIAANPVLGIGADNFGFEVNKYRSEFGTKNPDNPVLAEAESYIPERAHNEFLQIAAELGLVGIVIFSWFLFGIAVMGFRLLKNFSSSSPYAIAAVMGIGVFLVSSLVTSYSFRLIQNGFVFFFVLAVAAKLLLKTKNAEPGVSGISNARLRWALAAGCLACISLAGFSFIRVSSTAVTQQANQTASIDDALPIYRRAMSIDATNPEAPYFLGLRLIEAKRYGDAVPYLKDSIKIGKARSTDFSFLATAQVLSGDVPGAEKTFAEAAALYPRSVFVLTRYAALLDANDKTAESEQQFARAASINKRAATTWWALINKGTQAASDLAFKNPDEHEVVMNLTPYDAIYAVIAERDIRFPDERLKFPWDKLPNPPER